MNIAGIANKGYLRSQMYDVPTRKPEVVEDFVNQVKKHAVYGEGARDNAQIRKAMANETGVGRHVDILA